MTTQDDLEQLLWDYIYGLLEPAAARALEERITSEHDVARAYAEARQRADLLGAAARISGPRIRCVPPNDEAIVRSASVTARPRERGLGWFLSSAALALVGLVGYAQWRPAAQQNPTIVAQAEQALASDFRRVIVTGPAQVQPELTNLYAVQLEDLNGLAATSSEFTYTLCDANDAVLTQQTAVTDADGNGTVAIDGSQVADEAKLKVWAERTDPSAAVELRLTRAEPQFETFFHFNKAAYAPGETVYYRTVTLPLLAAHDNREFLWDFALQSPTGGNTAAPISGATENGVGNGKVTLSDDLAAGRYFFLAQAGDALKGVQAEVAVTDASPTAPQPAILSSDEDALAQQASRGVRFMVEGGALVAGLENKVYFEAKDALGNPTNLRGTIVDSRARKVVDVASSIGGRGEFNITPQANEAYQLALVDSKQEDPSDGLALPAVAPDVFARLATQTPVIAAGAPLEVEVATTKAPAQLLVAATRGGANITQQFVEFAANTVCPATQRLSLPLTDEVAGVIHVTLYDVDQSPPAPIAQRLFYRAPTRYLNVALAPQSSGNRWNVRVVDEQQRPCAAVLGVNVVAESAAGIDGAQESLFAAWYAQPASMTPTLKTDSRLAEARRQELGLLLGTTLARSDAHQFNEMDASHFSKQLADAQQHPDAAEGIAPLGDMAQPRALSITPPLLADNLAPVEAAYERAVTAGRAARQDRLQAFALAICIASVLLLLAVAMLVTLRLAGRVQAWLPATGVAAAALVIGSLWLPTRASAPISIAARPVKSYSGAPLVLAQSQTNGEVSLGYQNELGSDRFGAIHVPTDTPHDGSVPTSNGYFFADLGKFSGGGGGVGGPVPKRDTRLGLLDRLAADDYYTLDSDHDSGAALANETALKSALGQVALHRTKYAPLPILRYTTDALAAQPQPTPAPIDKEAIFWDPLVRTNPQGEAELNFALPESGRYRITIDAHGGGRLGAFQQVIDRTPLDLLPAPAEKP